MSDLKAKQLAADLLSETLKRKPPPSAWLLWLGVVYPAAVIVFELATRSCAQNFFDPMPTLWHTLAVAAVPASNLLLYWTLLPRPTNKYSAVKPAYLMLASGFGIGIAAFYALIFLPLMPLAVVGIVFYGLGLLPMSPLVSFISALKLSKSYRVKNPGSLARPLISGIVAAVVLLIALDVPAAATRLGVQWAASPDAAERQRGLTLLRTIGDDDLLLRLCYDVVGRPSGLLSALVMFRNSGFFEPAQTQVSQSTTDIREIYYRVLGVPFNVKPAPFQKGNWARFTDFEWDTDHGGTVAGGRLKGLDLVASRIDGSISAADAMGYLEWVVEFRNTSPLDREARVQFALPPGGVVSRATLWVNGEEREAAYGGRAAVRAAYQRVAVQQWRDPLLVTAKGPDRILAQAFPVPRNGGTIKFKIGISAPLELDEAGKARLVLPAIVDRNFSFAPDVQHSLWVESKTALNIATASAGAGMTTSAVGPELFRITGTLSDATLARSRPAIVALRDPATGPRAARLGSGPEIVQEIAQRTVAPPAALVIVVDGSARVAGKAAGIRAALDKIPTGAPAGLVIAGEPARRLAIAPWTDSQKRAASEMLDAADFSGGQDNTPALAGALGDLEKYDGAALLWVHGPQPVAFKGSAGMLEQAASRLMRRPQLWLMPTEPGPNETLPDMPWAWSARTVPGSGAFGADIAGLLDTLYRSAPRTVILRDKTPSAPAAGVSAAAPVAGSDHIARLWANETVLTLMAQGESNRAGAVTLATDHRLVTPVSGAVVLETQQQYDESHLTPVTTASVPTVPEPEEWALILLAGLAFLWLMKKQGANRVAA